MIKTFAINLVSQNEKREHILNECEQHNIDAEIIEAVNGKELTEKQIHTLVYDYPACSLTRGEIGCALSHIAVYQHMIEENTPLALILEDDAILDESTNTVLDALQKLEISPIPQVYLLSPSHYYFANIKSPLTKKHTLNKIVDAYYAHGYVLNLAAAQALCSFLTPIKYEADRWGYFQQMGIVNINCVVPAPITTYDHDKSSSDIEKDRLKIKNSRDTYFRNLRKQEIPFSKKLKRLFLKIMITLHLITVIRQKV